MDTNTNPLEALKREQRKQWFKLHTERQAMEACKTWAYTITLDELCDTKNLPEVYHEHIKDYLLGNSSMGKRIKAIRRKPFSIKVISDIEVGDGINEYGERMYTVYKKGQKLQGLQMQEALQIYLKYGPHSPLSSCRGKVQEIIKEAKDS